MAQSTSGMIDLEGVVTRFRLRWRLLIERIPSSAVPGRGIRFETQTERS
jgi:hypothetical protein